MFRWIKDLCVGKCSYFVFRCRLHIIISERDLPHGLLWISFNRCVCMYIFRNADVIYIPHILLNFLFETNFAKVFRNFCEKLTTSALVSLSLFDCFWYCNEWVWNGIKKQTVYTVHIMYSSGNGNMKPNSTLLRFNCSKRLSISACVYTYK